MEENIMAVKPVVQVGHPALHQKSVDIEKIDNSSVRQLIVDLKDTMQETGLVGIAAPQIGVARRVFLTEPRQTETRPKDEADILRVYINPALVEMSSEHVEIYEGCGSVMSELFAPVTRPKRVTISAFDERGRQFHMTADGLLGRILLHEMDHLDGVCFLERVSDPSRYLHKEHYLQIMKNESNDRLGTKTTIKTCEYL